MARAVGWCMAACVVAAAPEQARAQDPGVDLQTFRPIVGPGGVFSVEGVEPLGHLEVGGSVMLNYSSEPLVTELDDEIVPVVNQQLALQTQVGVGIAERLQLDVAFPMYLVNDVTWMGEDASGFALGDMGLRAKGRIWQSQGAVPVGVGASAAVRLPTGDQSAFTGVQGVAVSPRAIVDAQLGPVYLAANLGVALQQEQELVNLSPGSAFHYGLGAELTLLEGVLSAGAELYGGTQLDEFFGDFRSAPLEGLVGVRLRTPAGVGVLTGAGGGLIPGFGSPGFRAIVGVSYAPPAPEAQPDPTPSEVTDGDEDGVFDEQDACPDQPEDVDGFEDEDGCPDPDNDGDGTPDDIDECPDLEGPAERQGCPPEGSEPEGEGEGEGDEEQAAPATAPELVAQALEEARTAQRVAAEQDQLEAGDADGDGIMGEDDFCPEQPGEPDNDGCPMLDLDDDGVADADDRCPAEAGPADNDGCPKG